jgi:hypothetical protein
MKWIVVLLLLANAGLFGWQTYQKKNAPPPKPEPVPEQEAGTVNRLPLLSELDPTALRERNLAGKSGSGAAAAGARCFAVGPFSTGDTNRTSVQAWLEKQGATVSTRQDERREVALYWVYFPPAASRGAAIAKVEQLRQKGVRDVLVVPKGDMANAISLGVFSKSISRDRRLVELRQKGYQPKVADRYRTVKADWLDVSVSDPDFLSSDFSNEFPTLELKKRSCAAS